MNNDDNKETLSQLIDGEWQDLDAANSVKMACADDQLKATWSRYHLIRDVIRNDAITLDPSLTSRISQAIEDEPTYSNVSVIGGTSPTLAIEATDSAANSVSKNTKTPRKFSYWRTGVSGVALAACVTLATVIGLNIWQGAPSSSTAVQSIAGSAAVPGQVLPEVELVSNKGTYWVTGQAKRSADAEKRLNMLLSNHIESSPTAERTGMLPYSRLVGYDSVSSEQ